MGEELTGVRWLALALLFRLSGPAFGEIVAEIPAGPSEQRALETLVSEDGYHYAHLLIRDGREVWTKDGIKLAEGPAGSIAFDKKTGLEAKLGFGGSEWKVHAALSADGSRLAYVRRTYDEQGRPRGYEVSVNGRPGTEYEAVSGDPLFSLDGRHLAYAALRGSQWRVIRDGVEGPLLADTPKEITFSPNGERLAYLAKGSDGWQYLYLENKQLKYWPWEDIVFSPDWTRFAGRLPGAERFVEIVDEKKFGPYSFPSDLKFSPDGRRLAYIDSKGGAYQVYVNGQPAGPESHAVPGLLFSPRGELYWEGQPQSGGENTLYVDGTPASSWRYITGHPRVAFSPQGGHSLFLASKGNEQFVVADGVPQARKSFLSFFDKAGFVFDNEQEFHYLSGGGGYMRAVGQADGVVLVCESLTKIERSSSYCASHARRIYKPRE